MKKLPNHPVGRSSSRSRRIAASLGSRAAVVDLLRKIWDEGRPITFDNFSYADVHYEDVHCDEEFDVLRDCLPFRMLVQTD